MLDDNGIRPPLIAAGINLFGGPLGLLHRHVTGAIPIRRNTKDPAYLITLKAYVAELLKKHDLFFYPEGGRSYSGELKPAKTGLLHAALQAEPQDLVIIPTAIAYDLVLEDHILARQQVKRSAASVHTRAGRDGAVRCRLPVARLRHVRRADLGRRRATPRRAATSSSWRIGSATRSAQLSRCCRRRVFARGDAAVDRAPRIWRSASSALIDELRAREGEPGVHRAAARPSTTPPSRSRPAASS